MSDRWVKAIILGGLGLGLLHAGPVLGDLCEDGELCEEPCPAANSCYFDEDCAEGMMCVPSCLPGPCYCNQNGEWVCWDWDCAGACVEVPQPEGPPSYTIIDLGTLGGMTSTALGINNLGQVVGSADIPDGNRHAYLWDAGVMTDLGTVPPTRQSEAYDINDVGQVVGISSSTANPGFAFLWEKGQMTQIGEAPTIISAYAINNSGQAVGSTLVGPDVWYAFLWEDEVMTEIPSGIGGEGSAASDNNNLGAIVGSASTGKTRHAFYWKDAVMTDIGTLGGEASTAHGINDAGQIVGWSERAPGGDRVFHAFLWESGEMMDLGVMAELHVSRAEDINNHGQVVISGGSVHQDAPVLYDPEKGMLPLRELLPPTRTWFQLYPHALNDSGQIAGYTDLFGRPHAFLMTPIRADFDDDGDVDLDDLSALFSCFGGPGTRARGTCKDCDINKNGSVDLADLQAFHWVFTGPVVDAAAVSSVAPVFNR